MVGEVPGGLRLIHPGDGIAQRNQLIQRRELAEFDPPAQGVGWPTSSAANGALESISALVSYVELDVTHLMPRRWLCRGGRDGERVALAGEGKPDRVLGIIVGRC